VLGNRVNTVCTPDQSGALGDPSTSKNDFRNEIAAFLPPTPSPKYMIVGGVSGFQTPKAVHDHCVARCRCGLKIDLIGFP
jgi:hypothetical protein